MPESERIVRREITSYGHVMKDDHGDKCGSCEKLDNLVKPLAESDPFIKYSTVDIYTTEGQKFATDNKVEEMPVSKDCKVYEGGKEDCRIVKGFDEKDWSDLVKPQAKVVEEPKEETQSQTQATV
jgi:hypothetical protein